MKTKEEMIEFEMNYCQHYAKGKGADMLCKAGMDLKTIKKVPTGKDQIKWGPCIGGHTLTNPLDHCPHWIRRTHEMGEKRYAAFHKAIHGIETAREAITTDLYRRYHDHDRAVLPLDEKNSHRWAKGQDNYFSGSGVMPCPVCNTGKLNYSRAAYNGHIHARCSTEGCVAWME